MCLQKTICDILLTEQWACKQEAQFESELIVAWFYFCAGIVNKRDVNTIEILNKK